jgi:hypothetical protein
MILGDVDQLTKWIIEMLEYLNSSSFEYHFALALTLFLAVGFNHINNEKESNNTDTNSYFRIIASALIPLFICFLIGAGVSGIDHSYRWLSTVFVIYFAYQVGRLSMAAHTKKPE